MSAPVVGHVVPASGAGLEKGEGVRIAKPTRAVRDRAKLIVALTKIRDRCRAELGAFSTDIETLANDVLREVRT